MDSILKVRTAAVFGFLSAGYEKGNLVDNAMRVDDLFANVDSYINTVNGTLVSIGGANVVYHGNISWKENVWSDIIARNEISPDQKFVNRAIKYAKSSIVNPKDKFIGTWLIDDSKSYHDILKGRGDENATYGTLAPYEWFGFLGGIIQQEKCVELRYIAGIVKKIGKPPFKTKHADKSTIVDVQLFYNMPNIIESLLNVGILRIGMEKEKIQLNGMSISLYSVLDEIALKVCLSPKTIMADIRKFLVYVVRYCGVNTSDDIEYLKHIKEMVDPRERAYKQERRRVGRILFEPYHQSIIFKNECEKGFQTLKKWELSRLSNLCDILLKTTLYNTSEIDFTIACSFLLKLIAIPGYGRALNYASSPRSAPEMNADELGISEIMYEMIITFHNAAVEAGYPIVKPKDWKQKCITFWRSTGSGVQSEKIKVKIEGKIEEVTVSKKMMIGAVFGNDMFRKKLMSRTYSYESPGNVGYRDVPGKATRAIYVLKLPTLHAQIATVSHLVDYVASEGKEHASANGKYDASHIHSGPGTTTGMRIFDNMDTITASSDPNTFYLGLDLSSYDSNNVQWNFRRPIMRALSAIGKDLNYEYDDDRITWDEMIEYAYGKGHVTDTIWDNGREPIIYIHPDKYEETQSKTLFSTKYVKKYMTGKDLPRVRPMSGCKFIESETEIFICDVDEMINDNYEIPWEVLKIGVLRDGTDFVYLTSEASGELSTLMFNSLMNLSMQEILRRRLHETRFGSRISLKTMKAVGDDSEWIGTLISQPESGAEIDEFLLWTKTLYQKMGHVVKEENMILIPLGSEFVQTFSKYGLYIPRDMISIIPSEKPRKILERMNFLYSVRNVLNAKISRGFSSIFSHILYLYLYRKLSMYDLRRHNVNVGIHELVLSNDNIGSKLDRNGIVWSPVRIRKMNIIKQDKFKDTDVTFFCFSSLCATLPSSARGAYWNPVLFNIHNYDSFFLYWISLQPQHIVRSIMITLYAYMKTRKWDDFHSSKLNSEVKVEVNDYKLTINDIFSGSVINYILNKSASIGRLDATNVPRRIIQKGLRMEKFMQPLQSLDREVESEIFIHIYGAKIPGFKFEADSWLLNMEIKTVEIRDEDRIANVEGSRFFSCLGLEQSSIKNSFGLIDVNERMSIGLDRLRIILSRDMALRSILSPEEVVSLLNEYGIHEIKDMEAGMALLRATGMEESIASMILTAIFENTYGAYPSSTNGALTDDFSSTLGIVNIRNITQVSFPNSFTKSQKIHAIIHAAQMQLLKLIMSQQAYALVSIDLAPENRRVTTVLGLTVSVIATSKNVNATIVLRALREDIMRTEIKMIIEKPQERLVMDMKYDRKIMVIPASMGKTQLQRRIPKLIDIEEFIRDLNTDHYTDSETRIETNMNWLDHMIELFSQEKNLQIWNMNGTFLISHLKLIPCHLMNEIDKCSISGFIPEGKILKNYKRRVLFSESNIDSMLNDMIKEFNDLDLEIVMFNSWASLYASIMSKI